MPHRYRLPLPLRVPQRAAELILDWFDCNQRSFPWRRPDTPPFGLLVAEMLLRRTRADVVGKVWPQLVRQYPSPQSLAAANPKDIRELLHPLGFAEMRSRALVSMAREIGAQYGGAVPQTADRLAALPHVGPYAANALASFAYGARAPVVDANVVRIYTRFFALDGLPANAYRSRAFWRLAARALPRRRVRDFNYALLDLGALVCRPRRPRCSDCPLVDSCRSRMADIRKSSRQPS